VEVYTAAAAAAAAGGGVSSGGGGGGGSSVYMNGSASRQADARVSDQDVFTGDYEVAAAGGQPLMW